MRERIDVTTPFWKRPAILALVASLALNAFFASVLLGSMTMADDEDANRPRGLQQRLLASAPEGARDVVVDALAAEKNAIEAARAQIWEARRRQLEILTAEVFEPDAFAEAQAEERGGAMARRKALHAAFAAAAADLSQEDRDTLARVLKDRLRRWEQRQKERNEQQ